MWNNAFFVTEKSGFHDIVVRLRHDVTKEVGFHNGDSFFEKSELSLLPYNTFKQVCLGIPSKFIISGHQARMALKPDPNGVNNGERGKNSDQIAVVSIHYKHKNILVCGFCHGNTCF